MLQTIIAVLLLWGSVIALSRLTVLYYTKKNKEEEKPNSERIRELEEDEELRSQYELFKHLVQEVKKRVRFKIGQETFAVAFFHDGIKLEKTIDINRDGWVSIWFSTFRGYYRMVFKLDADWLVDNEGFEKGYHQHLKQIIQILDSKEGE